MHITRLYFVIPTLFINGVMSAYDFVVIGGGNGGLVVASRLSEDIDVQVLVLEAGPEVESLPEVFVPGLAGTGEAASTLNWAYQTVPQENMNGRQLRVSAGRALGGSTISKLFLLILARLHNIFLGTQSIV
ncbi:hypothetical protein AGABI1DRAFT_45570 [Agaricus bisporus var. burnettii JB137-S8]|uniref:Uncharacterized protein n=1 Tax=Agaricus bisporus var. burnettii (strain JB137-S8 / ATCC MYA-4627 / FGSC 10392) TaxID=597362 RepID=K5XMY5_AGABU|nr:uncharacterized protein AGABI1DRAFT_45570 [Agaricus bisporus var. burnettii JB137-S8]EKM75980.1 hypothetical protein AGABI1DRAFT_45570 [Agaricus bisporus var. burnettii JB137-S8]